MDINKFFQSKIFKVIILGVAAFLILLLVFKVGTFIGFKKANFSYKWGENYHKNFAGPRGGFFKDFRKEFEGRDFINAHGVIGQIIKIEDSNIVIKGKDNVEKIVLVKDDSLLIERFKETIKLTDLKTDEYIIVIGEPNDAGQIEAKFIRVMPAPPPKTPF